MIVHNVYDPPECATGELQNVPIALLCAEARAQEANFVWGEPSEDAAGVELFRRAIAQVELCLAGVSITGRLQRRCHTPATGRL